MYWTTRDGRRLRIKDMETDHILNCLNLMDRQMCKAINMNMAMNDESFLEPPDEWVDTYEALADEYNRRLKIK